MLLHGATIAARHAHPYHWRRRFIGSALALRLLERGERITRLGLRPPVWLTLDSTRYSELARVVNDAVRDHGLNIRNLGNVSREAITGVYSTATGLIYPSTLDSSLSIARAVKRFLARPEGRMPVASAEEFVRRLLAAAK